MVQLQSDSKAIEATGTQVVGISYDSVEKLKKFVDAKKITFPLLSDEGSKTIHAFGIHYMGGLPHPCTYLIDQKGIVRAKLAIEGYKQRHENAELIKAAEEIK
ncbi:MAG: peroxiredoxin family protein [Planctomycetia bacterium]|nr:peroxiredoxin family protein [Planctomycetia bacterium]